MAGVRSHGGRLVYERNGRASEGFYGRGADLLLQDLATMDGPTELSLDDTETPFADTFAIGNITQYLFSPDGSKIAAIFERSVAVMDSAGNKLHEFRHTMDACDLAWFGDGSRLVTAHEDRLILWSVGSDSERTALINRADDWASLAVELLSRSFTDAECLQYGILPCPSLQDLRSSLG